MADDRDRLLAVGASARYGLIGRNDLRELGFSQDMVERRVRAGRWERVAPGVWRIAGTPPSWWGDLHAGLLWLGPRAAVSHLAAGAVLKFDGYEEGPVEFVVPRHMRGARGPWTVRSTRELSRIDLVWRNGLRVTSPSRTVIDLAALDVSAKQLGNAIDSAVRDGGSSPAYLRKRLTALRGKGRAGSVLLDRVMLDAGGHSYLERAMLRLLREAGLPRPTPQVIHRRGGKTIARVDFEFDDVLLILEVSGRKGHASDAERLKDAQRRNELQIEGFIVAEFVTTQVLDDPEGTIATVLEARQRATPRSGHHNGV